MITDRISLNIALKYLDQFEQNDGEVIDILFSRRLHDRQTADTVKFDNIEVLKAFIAKYAKVITFRDADCMSLSHYQLKMFTVLKNNTDKNLVFLDGVQYKAKAKNITPAVLENLNNGYLKTHSEVYSAFRDIMINEYILIQEEYIDCGYIEIHFPEAMERLKQLYNKYK